MILENFDASGTIRYCLWTYRDTLWSNGVHSDWPPLHRSGTDPDWLEIHWLCVVFISILNAPARWEIISLETVPTRQTLVEQPASKISFKPKEIPVASPAIDITCPISHVNVNVELEYLLVYKFIIEGCVPHCSCWSRESEGCIILKSCDPRTLRVHIRSKLFFPPFVLLAWVKECCWYEENGPYPKFKLGPHD